MHIKAIHNIVKKILSKYNKQSYDLVYTINISILHLYFSLLVL